MGHTQFIPSHQYATMLLQQRFDYRSLYQATAFLAALLLLACPGCGSRRAPAAANANAAHVTPASISAAPPLTADQVRAELENAVKAMPDDPQARLELALFYRNTNDLPDAERELIACWKRFPKFPRAPYYLGLLYLTHGRDLDAVAPLLAAAALSPQDALVQVNAGTACWQAGRQEQALNYARIALRIDPKVPDSYMLLARLYDHHGTADLALSNLRTYLQYSPNPAPGCYLMGRIYARQADRENALLWLQRAIAADPKNTEFLVTLGRIYYELFNTTHAEDGINCYRQALELDPNAWEAHLYLGRALADRREWEEAITHFRAALRTTDDPGPIYYDLGQALVKAGQQDEGRKALAEYKAYHEYTNGIEKLRGAVNAAPQDRARRYALAQFCLRYRQYDQALIALREADQKLGPDTTLQRLQAEAEAGRDATARRVAAQSGSGAMNPLSSLVFPPSEAASPLRQGGPGNGR